MSTSSSPARRGVQPGRYSVFGEVYVQLLEVLPGSVSWHCREKFIQVCYLAVKAVRKCICLKRIN